MNQKLAALIAELETFGVENDARATAREDKLLNIPRDTGEFLVVLVRSARAKRILEIGTSNGLSTLWLAYAVQPLNGTVVTIEISEPKMNMARANFARAELLSFVDSHLADARDFLQDSLASTFDFIFLDAERSQYVEMWQDVQRVLAPGGLIVVDNAISHAHELVDFVKTVRHSEEYNTSLVPVGKGEFLILKDML